MAEHKETRAVIFEKTEINEKPFDSSGSINQRTKKNKILKMIGILCFIIYVMKFYHKLKFAIFIYCQLPQNVQVISKV